MKKIKFFSNDMKSRILALVLSVAMALSGIPAIPAQAEGEGNPTPGTVVTEADPETLTRPIEIYGQNTLNSGKITVGKSVSTTGFSENTLDGVELGNLQPGENNFLVTLSQSAQAMGLASKLPVPIDAVFVLDTSGSMEDPYGSPRYVNMIAAANEAISALMSANEQNRVAVVAFSSQSKGGGSSEDAAANVLSDLKHYTGEAATGHLTRVDNEGTTSTVGTYVAGRNTTTIKVKRPGKYGKEDTVEKTVNAFRNAKNGGTDIQAGIAAAADILMKNEDVKTEVNGKEVTRMPFIIVLSDGVPTYTSEATNWYSASSIADAGEQGPGSAPYAGNGYLAAMVAAYYKGAITEHYYGSEASENNRCNIFTVGVDLDSIDSDSEKALAEMTLNPKAEYNTKNSWYTIFKGYMDSYTSGAEFEINIGAVKSVGWGKYEYYDSYYTVAKSSITASKNYVNGKNAKGNAMYKGGIQYNDEYFATKGTKSGLSDAFKKMVRLIQIKAVSLPTDTSVSADFGGYVHFYDPLGEYMEVKKVHGIVANGYFFKGATFAKNMVCFGTAAGDENFEAAMVAALNGRFSLANNERLDEADVQAIARYASDAPNQLYYNSDTDYDNSICWWGTPYMDSNDDEYMQYLGLAQDDSVAYIESLDSSDIPENAQYICRSYYFYGTAGGATAPTDDFLLLVVRVQRSLEAPYQQTVYVSIPGSLLSVDRVLITEDLTQNPVTYESFVQEESPVRIIYEAGLQSDINAQNVSQKLADSAYAAEVTADKSQGSKDNYDAATDTYYFYTNDWDRTKSVESHERALTRANFDVAEDNEFYTFVEDTVLYKKNGNRYTPLTGAVEKNTVYYYPVTYYDWTGATAKDTEKTLFTCEKKVYYREILSPNEDSVIAAYIGTNTSNQKYVKAGVHKSYALSAEKEDTVKANNYTGTSIVIAHPLKARTVMDSHYSIYLGNNGRLALTAENAKTVQITKADASNTVIEHADGTPVTIGDELTYTVKVKNSEGKAATAVVTDSVPAGTKLVEGSITKKGVYEAESGKITWTLSLEKDEEAEVSFRVVVTEEALEEAVASINNTAKVKLGNNPEYTTNTTKNPPQGKKVTDTTTGEAPEGGLQVGQVLTYTIKWVNNTNEAADVVVTDVLPAGTTLVEDSISNGGVYEAGRIVWTIKDAAAGTEGYVSFRAIVNESAKTPVENGATIKVGTNNPEFKTNTTTNDVLTGDLQLEKKVQVVSGSGSSEKEFTLKLTTKSALSVNSGMLQAEYQVEGSKAVKKVAFTNGVATVKIKDGEKLTIKGLPAGLEIKVEEQNVPEGYTATYSNTDQKVVIKPTGQGTAAMTITNRYAATETSLILSGQKKLTTAAGAYLGNTAFTFQVYDYDIETGTAGNESLNTTLATVSTDQAQKSFSFVEKKFTAPGVYYYLVKESNTGMQGVTYDATQYLVKVTVEDDGKGKLAVTGTTYMTREGDSGAFTTPATGIVFENSYEPNEVVLTMTGTKQLTGRKLQAEEFAFLVKENNQTVATGIAGADGKITFTPITYYAPGEHTYKISELNSKQTNIIYDTKEYTAVVKVEDVNGQLTITKQSLDNLPVDAIQVAFTNAYTPSEVEINLVGQKTYVDEKGNNVTLKGNDFTFGVDQVDKDGGLIKEEVAVGQNDASGKIAFSPITIQVKDGASSDYSEKLYYQIKEIVPVISKDPYIDYDETVIRVEVTVQYEYATGKLTAQVTKTEGADGTIAFKNVKYPDSISVQPVGLKTTEIAGGTLPDNVYFSFAVKNVATGNTVATGSGGCGTNVAIEFSKMTYSHTDSANPAVYNYWVVESNTANVSNGITYDTSRYLMTVTIRNTDGKLSADVAYFTLNAGADESSTNVADYTTPITQPTFTNQYDAKGQINLTAKKVVTGNFTLTADQFAFRLQRMEGLTGEATTGGVINGVNDANGTIRFATLLYGLADIPDGMDSTIIRYRMSEIIPMLNPIPGITYDNSTHDIYVKLTNDGAGGIQAELCDKDGNVYEEQTNTGVVFTNSYAVKEGVNVEIQAEKVLNGRSLAKDEFTFGLYFVDADGKETLIETAKNTADGKVTFTHYYPPTTAEGTHHYVIREQKDTKGGITYDEKAYRVNVTLVDETAKLKVTEVAYPDGKAVFTNTYKATETSFTPTAKKVLNGRQMTDKEFSFQVVSNDGDASKVVSVGQNDANGNITFSAIRYADLQGATEKTYTYAIQEVAGTRGGVTYDKTVYYLKVTVKDDGTGALTATGAYYTDVNCTAAVSEAVFNNTYKAANGSVTLTASKTLTGREMKASEFDFVVTDLEGKEVTVGNNEANGAVSFGTISYTHEDLRGAASRTFTYWMYEKKPVSAGKNGVTYDTAKYKAVVTVTDNSYGVLTTEVAYYQLNANAAAGSTNTADYTTKVEKAVFRNTYVPTKTSITIEAEKALTGKTLQAGEFSFTLTDERNQNVTAVNDANGRIQFVLDKAYSKAGVYTYTLQEEKQVDSRAKADGTYTYDNSVYTVVVTVTDNGLGTLSASAVYKLNGNAVEEAVFNNHYVPKKLVVDLSTEISAKKTIKNYTLAGFVFEVLDESNHLVVDKDGNPLKGISDADGKITFPSFTFTEDGEFHYKLREVDTEKGGVTYDKHEWELYINIEDDYANGKLKVASVNTYLSGSKEQTAPEFVNVYKASPVKVTITATKALVAEKGSERTLKNEEFRFRVMEGDIIRAESYNDAEGTISFTFTEDKAGVHNYTIVEVIPETKADGMTYDNRIGSVSVQVVDDGSGQLKVNGSDVYKTSGSVITFTNTYAPAETEAVITAKKILKGAELNKGAYQFELVDLETRQVVATAANEADGTITFRQSYDEVGTHAFYIREAAGTDENVTYDTREYKVVVQIVDNQTGKLEAKIEYAEEPIFENIFKTPPEENEYRYKTFTFTKVWVDNENKLGKRPDRVTIEIYQDGVYVNDIVLSEENGWTNTSILMSANGDHEYTWTIKEKNVPEGYVATYSQSGYTVTNTLKSLTTSKVQTGDNSGLGIFLGMSMTTLLAAGWLVFSKLHKKELED